MIKIFVLGLLLLSVAAPALAKPRDVYPVSCDALWTAVKDTLGDRNDYGVSSINDVELKASFVVIGNWTVYTDRVALLSMDGGCQMKTDIKEIGPENSDWRRFHNRVTRSLRKLQAGKAASAPKSAEGPL